MRRGRRYPAEAEILIVCSADTLGWRTIENEFAASLERLGTSYEMVRPRRRLPRLLKASYMSAELFEARAAARLLRRHLRSWRPAAVVMMSTTASFLASLRRLRAYGIEAAVRLDCPAAVNRPGFAGLPQRTLERRRMSEATAVIAMGPRSMAMVSELRREAIDLPITIDVPPSGEPVSPRRLLAYVGNPARKGLDRLVRAWNRIEGVRGDAVLTISGVDPIRALGALARAGVDAPRDVEWTGMLNREQHLELLHGAAAYVSASRWEECGIAQLEALAAGVPLVTTPALGAYEAEPIARKLAPELVVEPEPEPLSQAMLIAARMTGERRRRYAEEAAELLEPFRPAAVDRVMAERVLPALLQQ